MSLGSGIAYPALVMGVLGLIFGSLLAYASIRFFVPTDERVGKIREILPGANCGGCGFPGCDGYADAIVNEGCKTNLCAAGGAALAAGIAEIMGVASEKSVPVHAFLKCQGAPDVCVRNAVYDGITDCRSAAILPGGGPSSCPFSCIGLGTCVSVCVFGAMTIQGGLATVDPKKCVGCGTCVVNCPKSVLALVPKESSVQVACNSNWRGPDVKKVCGLGCIGCGMCSRACPVQAITVANNLAAIDPEKCTNCGLCVTKCPTKSIVSGAVSDAII